MQANGQPQIAASQKGIAEKNAPDHGVRYAQHGGVRVTRVRKSEENADGKHRCPGSDLLNQQLKGVAAKQNLLSCRPKQQDHQVEGESLPGAAGSAAQYQVP